MRKVSLARMIFNGFVSISLPFTALAAEPPSCPRADGKLTADALKTVVITQKDHSTVFDGDRFSLSLTLQSILATAFTPKTGSPIPVEQQKALASSHTEQLALLTSLIRSFRNLDRSSNGVTNNATFRLHEAELEPEALLASMKPVGLFNRFDLAPANWSYCGEHRVVYAMGTGTNRMFLIFEAAVDNPDPTNAEIGCQRIAEFWGGLQSKPEGELPDALRSFYYDGELGDGKPPITPVLHNQHFGVPFGQVRGNLFLTQPEGPGVIPWMLREWRTFPSAQSVTTLVPDTVKSNPNPELYNDDPINLAGNGRDQGFVDLRAEFQDKFVVSHVRELIDVDLEAALQGRKPTGDELFNQLSAAFDDKFNDFESVSQGSADVVRGSSSLISRIDHELMKYKLPTGWTLTPEHILARAEALSCAGCHNLTQGKEIAPQADIKWPNALAFTHINEKAELSEALVNSFLPARCDNLQRFLRRTEPTVALSEPSSEVRTPALAKTRLSVTTFENAITDAETSTALSELASDIQTARQQDSVTAGAFRRFRRTH
ncbi:MULTISPECIES: hypothetical protein [Rhizobium]|uniref:Cytochrome c domain-containing protein n=1 Tax=Rhizobium changzhiense TaxID=2692317 RepID=A0ABR6AGA0_9HYPH|nr:MULTISPECIES: hypothetical protein [Rhizobium]MBA5805640.1 hypothetical protein [Rhizobium changzhiense]MCW0015565.1 hypothetical protein [Rhizobium sp. BT-226]